MSRSKTPTFGAETLSHLKKATELCDIPMDHLAFMGQEKARIGVFFDAALLPPTAMHLINRAVGGFAVQLVELLQQASMMTREQQIAECKDLPITMDIAKLPGPQLTMLTFDKMAMEITEFVIPDAPIIAEPHNVAEEDGKEVSDNIEDLIKRMDEADEDGEDPELAAIRRRRRRKMMRNA